MQVQQNSHQIKPSQKQTNGDRRKLKERKEKWKISINEHNCIIVIIKFYFLK